MKVIFLDFDGVLNSAQHSIYQRRYKNEETWFGRYLLGPVTDLLYKIFTYVGRHDLTSKALQWHLYYGSDHCYFCPIACSNLQFILDQVPDAKIVVSSVWRTWGMEALGQILNRNGIDTTRLYSVTGREPGVRGTQIKAWLERNPETKSFVIIDDDADMEPLMDRLVKTHSYHGLNLVEAEKAIELLGNEVPISTLFHLNNALNHK